MDGDVQINDLGKKYIYDRVSSIKRWPIGKFKRMPTEKQRNRSLLPEQLTIQIFMINWALEAVREICIDLSKADTIAYRVLNASVVLMKRSDRRTATKKWREHFEQISTNEFAHQLYLSAPHKLKKLSKENQTKQ